MRFFKKRVYACEAFVFAAAVADAASSLFFVEAFRGPLFHKDLKRIYASLPWAIHDIREVSLVSHWILVLELWSVPFADVIEKR
jgi:hypothetical protein